MTDNREFIAQLTDDQPVEAVYLAADKSVRETRNGDPYLCITLQDRTGTIEARGWDDAEMLAGRFETDDFIAVRGRVSSYRGELQITVSDVDLIDDGDVELRDFLPHSRWDADELFDALRNLVDEAIESREVRRFLNALFDDDAWRTRFCRAPAAVSNHHAYLAGLVEHTLSMARLAVTMGRHYEAYYPGMVDTDLLVAGAVIHDMAKIEELEYRRSFDYSTRGRLVGHIARGSELVGRVADRLDPPLDDHLTTQLQHLVLSHHGKREYGSPVTPRIPEAILLHHLDMIDSRMNSCWDGCRELVEGDDSEGWSDYLRTFDGSLYVKGTAADGWQAEGAKAADETTPGIDPSAPSPAASESGDGAADSNEDDARPTPDETNLHLFDD